jgi:hypothetical protein
VFERFGAFVGGFLLAPKDHGHATFRIEPDDHVRAFVDRPDIVLSVDAHRMRKRPGIKILADFTDEAAVGSELQQLRGAGGISGATGIAAGKHEYVFFGIDRDAGRFAEIHIRRQLQRIGNRIKRNLRRRLLR